MRAMPPLPTKGHPRQRIGSSPPRGRNRVAYRGDDRAASDSVECPRTGYDASPAREPSVDYAHVAESKRVTSITARPNDAAIRSRNFGDVKNHSDPPRLERGRA